MAQARCKNGHIYDREIYGDDCPYCDRGTGTISFGGSAPRERAFFAPEEIGRSEPVSAITPEDIGRTAPPKAYLEQMEEIGKTQPAFKPREGSDPVVGWLVCVSGHEAGKDYRLAARMNTIGRGGEMDVHIKGDDAITSNTHAKIDYDVLNNAFYLLPANNANTIYCNGAPVYAATKLAPYDRLRLGLTELLFVPFCCERFTWPAAEQTEA